jgi:hypothetical protein
LTEGDRGHRNNSGDEQKRSAQEVHIYEEARSGQL